ncbi:MAG: type II toxin-antitoxin system RelE/ParE family toxin [Anaerolinea sp.]|nr:type II toxin-antitoxin system RelE/ParE family toxin [Anaerolinea sp.]
MNVVFKQSLAKDLQQVRDSALLKRVQTAIEQIETAASLHEIRQLKKLAGNEFYYRVRIGNYRLGLRIEGNTITIVRFLHRKEIYRYFP